MPSIAGQHVVVLGGTSGFGFATAKAAIAEGARVTIASRSAEKLRGALDRLGNRASGECVDVTNKPMLERFFAGLGSFAHLAVTVGDPLLNKPIIDLTDEEARSAFEVRFWGQFNAVRAAYPHISKSGSITLVSGLAGQRASPGRGIYAGVLGGIEGMVKSVAAELRPLRVNGVCAGAVDTELWHRSPEAERLAMFERIGARLPVGRVGKPEDIAEAYLYLMKTGFSTGETIVVDGGALQAPWCDHCNGRPGGRQGLVNGPRRRYVPELIDRLDDAKPDCDTGEVIGRREFINPPDAFRLGRVAVPAEHQLSGAPNVDLGDLAAKLNGTHRYTLP